MIEERTPALLAGPELPAGGRLQIPGGGSRSHEAAARSTKVCVPECQELLLLEAEGLEWPDPESLRKGRSTLENGSGGAAKAHLWGLTTASRGALTLCQKPLN